MTQRRRIAPRRRLSVDVVVAALLLAGSVARVMTLTGVRSTGAAVAACVVSAGAVAVRRRVPGPAALAALIGLVGYELATHDPNGAFAPVAVVLTFYSVGRAGDVRRRLPGMAMLAADGLAAAAVVAADGHSSIADAVSAWVAIIVLPIVAGGVVARRHDVSVRLAVTIAELRAEQQFAAERARAEERNRVARDLHDVVAHCVSVMVVQAGAARLIAAQDFAAAQRALGVIASSGRDALTDLRRVVGVLHRDRDPDFGAGGGLADLEKLADRVRLGGVTTTINREGVLSLPAAIDLVAYRVAQEALTNVVKHAGPGAAADVSVSVGAYALSVDITNTNGVGAPPPAPDSGHGLTGMRERVTTYGGTMLAAPRPDGGYGVHVWIPLPTADASAEASAPTDDSSRRRWPSWLVDLAIAVAWLAAMEIEVAFSSARHGSWALNAAAVAVMALASLRRRRHPLVFLAIVGALAAALSGGLTSLDRATITGLYTLAVPMFTVAAWQKLGPAVGGLCLWLAGATGVALATGAAASGFGGAAGMGVVIWAAGRVWRSQRELHAELMATTAQLAAERTRSAELAVESERTRISRELHGVVARSVVTMVVQAEVAQDLLCKGSIDCEDAIRAIETTGREALMQLRRILGVLRAMPVLPALDDVPEEVLA